METLDAPGSGGTDYRASINFLRKHFEELHRRSHS
jgi:hypothetical protein